MAWVTADIHSRNSCTEITIQHGRGKNRESTAYRGNTEPSPVIVDLYVVWIIYRIYEGVP
jgi:hypothetical protein